MSGAFHFYGANRRLGCLLALCLCVLTGCIDRSTEGKTSVYTYSLWLVVTAILGGMALIYIGYSPRPGEPRLRGYFNIMLGLVLMAVAVPMLRTDRVEVDKDHFTSTHGLPWNRLRHDVQFKSLREIRIEVTEKVVRYQRRKEYALVCRFKSGNEEKVPIGNVMRDAVSQILGIADQRRVSLVGVELLPEAMRPR